MPFYEYECTACKFYVEALQKISDPPLRKCPSCKKQALKKLVSAPVFRLKGSGWYETDFKSEQEQKRNLAGGEEAPERSEAKEDGKTAGAEAKDGAGTGADAQTPVKPVAKPAAKSTATTGSAAAGPRRSSKPASPARPATTARPAARPAARSTAKKKTGTKKAR
ncbi:hypothetical protein ACG33_11930 [Steroidobacter denitrificans]|uniref:Putative regulatory protein FmdB zinc ribbon domain-containing protein n=1 Tax=Steroidobacter denitrificans TaxID=465721 RepID=A0A127FBK2_STEDE|nr:zinc ribbon domain-containing protein [Steroidobacter denitrificans]AMN47792.1 hypothetical protein ACG33_11930 [Steroidobacter denitrificans]